MTIMVTQAPSKRSTGRSSRLSEEDIKDLRDGLLAAFEAVEKGKVPQWLTDSESVDKRSAAYQRAQSARNLVFKIMPKEYKIEQIKTTAEPVDENDLSKGFIWKIGPRPKNEKVRKARSKTKPSKDATPKANGSSEQA